THSFHDRFEKIMDSMHEQLEVHGRKLLQLYLSELGQPSVDVPSSENWPSTSSLIVSKPNTIQQPSSINEQHFDAQQAVAEKDQSSTFEQNSHSRILPENMVNADQQSNKSR